MSQVRSTLDQIISSGSDSDVVNLYTRIHETLAKDPVDLNVLGKLGHKALLKSADELEASQSAYSELYWIAEMALLEAEGSRQLG